MRRTLKAVCPLCAGEVFEWRADWFFCEVDGARAVTVPIG